MEAREPKTELLRVQVAPSNRAECRKCKAKIDKGTVRIAVCFDDGERRSSPWNHLDCFFLPKKYITEDIQPGEIDGYKELSEEQKLALEDRILKLKSGEIKKVRLSGKKAEQEI